MPPNAERMIPGEEVLIRTRPAWSSFWVFFLGLLVCGVGPFLKENPPLRPVTGLIFAAVFALIILRRWSNIYTLTNRRLLVEEGLIARDTTEIKLRDVSEVEVHQGLTSRLGGTGHLLIRSRLPDQSNILVYGQPDHVGLKERIERLAAAARVEAERERPAPSSSSPADHDPASRE